MSETSNYDTWLKNRYVLKDKIKTIMTNVFEDRNPDVIPIQSVRELVNITCNTNLGVVEFASFNNYINDLSLELQCKNNYKNKN
jgi:hypothetical protein